MSNQLSTTERLLNIGPDIRESEKGEAFNQLISDVQKTFGTGHGRRVLLHLISNTYQHESAMTGNSFTYFNIALVDWGRALMDLVATADFETHQWVHAQHANKIKEQYMERMRDGKKPSS